MSELEAAVDGVLAHWRSQPDKVCDAVSAANVKLLTAQVMLKC